jgi:hypothetical protein
MRSSRFILAPLVVLTAASAVIACGGGADGQLSPEEYFRRIDEIDKELDSQSEEIFADTDVTTAESASRFVAITDTAKGQLQEIEPPDDLKHTHDILIEAVDEFGDAMDSASDAAPEGAVLSDLFADSELITADQDLVAAFCAVQREADERGIGADTGCDRPLGEGSPAP